MARTSTALRLPPKPVPSPIDTGMGLLGTGVGQERRRGRGTLSNASGRYEPIARIAFDDGWQSLEELPPFKTTVPIDATRKIITRNESPDISFDRSINPYRGCEHGCVYCFARPTHAYLGLSPGLDFESKLFVKPDAPAAAGARTVRAQLRAAHDRDRHQHRSVSADRAEVRDHAPHPRSAGARRPSGRHRHQVGAGPARHRHPGAHGEAQSGQGRDLGDDARSPSSRAPWSRARRRRRAGSRRCGNFRRPAFRPR